MGQAGFGVLEMGVKKASPAALQEKLVIVASYWQSSIVSLAIINSSFVGIT